MLDRLIEAQADPATRTSRIIRRISRLVALPALLLMLGGLLLYAVSQPDRGTRLPGPPSINLGELLNFGAPIGGAVWAANLMMSLGLLGLALVPGITVAFILIEHLRGRRWQDAIVALVVVGVLTLSVFLGKG